MNIRGGRLPFFHVDLYRLETREQIIAAGLEQYLVRPEGVTVVEWVERWLEGTRRGRGGPGRFRRARSKRWAKRIEKLCYEDIGG